MTNARLACHHAALSTAHADSTIRSTSSTSTTGLPAPYHATSPSTSAPRHCRLPAPPHRLAAIARGLRRVMAAGIMTSLTAMTALTAVTASSAGAQAPQPEAAAPVVAWPDTYQTRLQAQALIQTANAEILGNDSATLTLEKWCRTHRISGTAEPKVVARLVRDIDKPASAEQRQRLQVAAGEAIRYRRVQLTCGATVLSEADNWYVPGRLTPEMNRQLEQTDTPFGKVVLGLVPFRRTFAANLLWSPLPPNWEMLYRAPSFPPGPLTIPPALFEHRAVVFGRDLRPIAEVAETYQHGLLAFPVPPQ